MARPVVKPDAGAALERDVRAVEWELRGMWARYVRVRLTLSERCVIPTVMGVITKVSVTGAFVIVDGWHVPMDEILAVGKPTRVEYEEYLAAKAERDDA